MWLKNFKISFNFQTYFNGKSSTKVDGVWIKAPVSLCFKNLFMVTEKPPKNQTCITFQHFCFCCGLIVQILIENICNKGPIFNEEHNSRCYVLSGWNWPNGSKVENFKIFPFFVIILCRYYLPFGKQCVHPWFKFGWFWLVHV